MVDEVITGGNGDQDLEASDGSLDTAINAGNGDDTMTYVVALNADSEDRMFGGNGHDTLVIDLSGLSLSQAEEVLADIDGVSLETMQAEIDMKGNYVMNIDYTGADGTMVTQTLTINSIEEFQVVNAPAATLDFVSQVVADMNGNGQFDSGDVLVFDSATSALTLADGSTIQNVMINQDANDGSSDFTLTSSFLGNTITRLTYSEADGFDFQAGLGWANDGDYLLL